MSSVATASNRTDEPPAATGKRLTDTGKLTSVPAGLLAGALSGGLCFLAFPPVDAWVLAPVALIPLAIHFSLAGRGAVAASGAAFGLVFNGLLLYWIRLFGPAPYVALTIVQTLWIVAALLLGVLVRDRMPERLRILALPLVFLLQEFFRSQMPWGGFAWGGLGYTQHNNLPALKLAAYTGVWGLSLAVALVNCLLAWAFMNYRTDRKRALAFVGGVVALALLPGLLPVSSPAGETAKIAMVQGNVPRNTLDPNSDDDIVVDNHLRLTEELDDADLVVWPEGAFDVDPLTRPDYRETLLGAVERQESPFLVGAILGSGTDDVRNSSLFINADGTPGDSYTKQRLVPFGEFVPLRSFLQPKFEEINRIPVDLSAGTEATVFEIPQGKFASVICYESTYADLVRTFVNRGARMLVVSTNFSSFDLSAASAQHVAFSQLRAAEQRMWVAHASISGISAVVDPQGRVLETTNLFEPAVLTPTVRFATTTTPYAKLGDWVPWGAVLAVIGSLVAPFFRRRPKPES
ncbi:MAG TPA: apolipoprotein N-acyltransferase [Actinomycetota bacterium]|nr:apolipoprotein N-acyltransferase [Actinomycetota bacterium]